VNDDRINFEASTPRPTGSRAICLVLAGVMLVGCEGKGFQWGQPSGGEGARRAGLFGARSGSEPWTIECGVYDDEDHRELADELERSLRAVRDLKADRVSVQHDEERSIVYYGRYDLGYEPDGETISLSDEIKGDLRFIRTLTMADGQYPFLGARPIPAPSEDVGPPEWNLENASGTYTLQIGWTHNTAGFSQRKQAATEWVRDLRQRGYEAYYHHSPDRPVSLVTVATFDESAVERTPDGRERYAQAVRDLQANPEFCCNLENGHRVIRTLENGEKRALPSFLVRIPKRAARGDSSLE